MSTFFRLLELQVNGENVDDNDDFNVTDDTDAGADNAPESDADEGGEDTGDDAGDTADDTDDAGDDPGDEEDDFTIDDNEDDETDEGGDEEPADDEGNEEDTGDDEAGDDAGEEDDDFTVDGDGGDENEDTEGDGGGNEDAGDDNDTATDSEESSDGEQSEFEKEAKAAEEQIYDTLTDDQKRIRLLQLKLDFKSIYENLMNTIEGINNIPKNNDNIETIKRLQFLTTKSKTILIDYIANNFDNNTYIENYTFYIKYMAIFRTITKTIEEINESK